MYKETRKKTKNCSDLTAEDWCDAYSHKSYALSFPTEGGGRKTEGRARKKTKAQTAPSTVRVHASGD